MKTLRLSFGDRPGRDRLDGGWWPHSRSFALEFARLVEGFPRELGRVVAAVYSAADWDDAPRRVAVRRGHVKVAKSSHADTHFVDVTTADRVVHRLLVVPSGFDTAQGEEALLASATRGNSHPAGELLDAVTNELAVDPAGVWT